MNRFFKRLGFGAVLLWGAVGVPPAEAKLFDMEEFYLDNGLQVVVIPNYKAPIVQQMVWYKTGSVEERPGKGGTAHLLEHLMFRGTDKVKDDSFNKIIEENGGVFNAFTSRDYTAYHEFVDVSRLELVMFLEADRMRNLKITPEYFEKERDIVFQERKQVVENQPTSYFSESLTRDLWQEHPYARPVTGTIQEIEGLKLADVEGFYKDYYMPNNALLVLSGDVNYATAQELARKYYGDIEKRPVGPKADFPMLDKKSATKVEMKLPQIATKRFVQSFVVPSYVQDRRRAFALDVLAKYLGGGETSKLYKKLVLDEEAAVGVSASYDMTARSYGTFTIAALPKENLSNEEFSGKLTEAVDEAVRELNAEELQKAKKRMLAGLTYLKDDPRDAANIVGLLAVSGMSVEDIENYDVNINNVSLSEIRVAAQELMNAINVQGILVAGKGRQ